MSANLTRAGYLTGTVPADPAYAEWDLMVEAALYQPNTFAFEVPRADATPCGSPEWECELIHTHPVDTVTVDLGYAVYDRGVHYVAYQVTVSATGEIIRGLDFFRDQHAEVRTRVAAVALLGELARVMDDTKLAAFAASLA